MSKLSGRKRKADGRIEALSVDEWFTAVKNEYGLTIEDIRRLQPNESMEVLFIDRNFMDTLESEPNGLVDVAEHVRKRRGYFGKYTRISSDSLKGKFKWYTLHNRVDDDFEWDVFVQEMKMYLPTHNDQVVWAGPPTFERRVVSQVDELPSDTLVGWRGCSVRLEDVPKLPLMLLNPLNE